MLWPLSRGAGCCLLIHFRPDGGCRFNPRRLRAIAIQLLDESELPVGTYFARVRALLGTPGGPSNEVIIVVP